MDDATIFTIGTLVGGIVATALWPTGTKKDKIVLIVGLVITIGLAIVDGRG
jgi:hypothetical protein